MTAYKSGDPTTINRLYGRSKGKPLRAGQQGLVDSLLPRIAMPAHGPITSQVLFGDDRPLHFEIGFGGGEHMAARADMLPDHGFIGAEPFLNGVAQALVHVDGDGGKHPPLGNVRIHHGDALEVLQALVGQDDRQVFDFVYQVLGIGFALVVVVGELDDGAAMIE